MEGLLLDAQIGREGLELVLAGPGGLHTTTLKTDYRVYLLPNRYRASSIMENAWSAGLDAWVEEWRRPPWYDSSVKIVVVSHSDPRVIRAFAAAAEREGAASKVNTYPGMLVDALWRAGARPGCIFSEGEPPDCEGALPPPVRVARLRAYAWHGPVSSVHDEALYYVVECRRDRVILRSASEAVDRLEECRPHIIEARLEDVHSLPREPPGLRLDPERSLVSARGMLEWMRVSWLPWSMAHQAPIGKILTAAEAREAFERKYLVRAEEPRREAFRPLEQLAAADMAGAARIPSPGTYWNVSQLDFTSLYPTLISKHNLSAETVARPVPCGGETCPAGHRVCSSPRGIVASVLGRLVEMRARYKRQGLLEEAEALKWVLVSGFGYLGYRNSLFGSIAAYECVTSLARQALATAEEVAERLGYRVVHSIIDSIMIEPRAPRASPREVAEEIGRRVGVPVRVDAEYDWLYIPETLRGAGAVNKYYGRLRGGRIKMRGIAAVRRDTPPLIAMAQAAAIRALASARSPRDMPEALKTAREIIMETARLVAEGRASPALLAISKRPSSTGRRTPWARASKGMNVDTVKYVMTPHGPWPVWRGPPPLTDRNYYLRLLAAAARELPPGARPQPVRTKIIMRSSPVAHHERGVTWRWPESSSA
ncbi:MAG: hypothetical protein F7C34_01815 [Desulfurococcales archaeon]|nr:hypothetical protein [Desulfurococcales archaeon]